MTMTILDGGMGQELLARSGTAPTSLWATQIMRDEPELVRAVHDDYFAAGADVATTNTYAVHRDRLAPHGLEESFEALHRQACEIAVRARDAFGSGQVAGAMGPTSWSYRPDLAPPAGVGAEIYAEIARIQAPYVDLFICETMSSVEQARGALLGALSAGRPVWLAVSVNDEDGSQLRSGEPVTNVLSLLDELKPAALLVNCSRPEAVSQAIPLLTGREVPVGGYANGFKIISPTFTEKGATVDILQRRDDLGPVEYVEFAVGWAGSGATIIGGCCEIGPSHIRELAARLKA